MDQRVSAKFIKKTKQLCLLQIDLQELMSLNQYKSKTKNRCVLFVRPHGVTQIPDLYLAVVKAFRELKLPHIEISEQIFECVLLTCDQNQQMETTYAATLQGLPQEQLQLLSQTAGYANNSSISYGFGNNAGQIRLTIPPLTQTNSFIQTMIFVTHDFNHYFSPLYSDQMRCDVSIGLQMVVPVTMYRPHTDSDSYSPIQLLPPLCDDPTNPHFYTNDCRPVNCYLQQIKTFPMPRLVIRGLDFLPNDELMMLKQDELTKQCQTLSSQYYQYELLLGIAVNSMCRLVFDQIVYQFAVQKQIMEQIQQVKNNQVKQAQSKFLYNSAQNKLQGDIFTVQQLSTGDTTIRFKDISKTVELFCNEVIKQVRAVVNMVYYQCSLEYDKQYLKTVIENVDKEKVKDFVLKYTHFQSIQQTTNLIIDFDEFEVIMSNELQRLLIKKIISGEFNKILQYDEKVFDGLQECITYQCQLSLYTQEEKVASQDSKQPSQIKLSNKTINDLKIGFTDQIDIAQFQIKKPIRSMTTFQTISILEQMVMIHKTLKQKSIATKSPNSDCNEYYVLQQQQDSQNGSESENEDEEEVNSKTMRERYKNLRLQEDTSKGKCNVCPLVYNNYREHCRSQVHQTRYMEQLKAENLIKPLQNLQKKTSIRNQILTVFANLCNFIAQKERRSYFDVANEINSVLKSMGHTYIYVDPHDEPRSNSPSCRNESFRSWREEILKQRMNDFEKILTSKEAELHQKFQKQQQQMYQVEQTIAFGCLEYEKAHRKQCLKKVLDQILLDLEKQFKIEDIKPLDRVYYENEVPQEAYKDFSLHDVLDNKDLYGQLANVCTQCKCNNNIFERNKNIAHQFDSGNFVIVQEDIRNQLNYKFFSRYQFSLDHSFNFFLQQFENYQIPDNSAIVTQKKDIKAEIINSHKESQGQVQNTNNFSLHLRSEVDKAEIEDHNSEVKILGKLLKSTISPQKEIKFQIKQDLAVRLCQNRLILPPIYKMIPKSEIPIKGKLELAQCEVELKTDLQKLCDTMNYHRADVENMLKFSEFEQITFDYDTADDCELSFTNSKLELPTRSNSASKHLDKDMVSLRMLRDERPAYKQIFPKFAQNSQSMLQQTEVAEETFTDYSQTKLNLTAQPALKISESGNVYSEFVRGFDFVGDYVSIKSLNLNALNAASGVFCSFLGPDCIAQPALQIYDHIIFGVLSQLSEHGVDAPTCSLVSQAVSVNLLQGRILVDRDQYKQVRFDSRTVARAQVQGALFNVLDSESE